jgi:hypothetical protein
MVCDQGSAVTGATASGRTSRLRWGEQGCCSERSQGDEVTGRGLGAC